MHLNKAKKILFDIIESSDRYTTENFLLMEINRVKLNNNDSETLIRTLENYLDSGKLTKSE